MIKPASTSSFKSFRAFYLITSCFLEYQEILIIAFFLEYKKQVARILLLTHELQSLLNPTAPNNQNVCHLKPIHMLSQHCHKPILRY